MEALFDQQGFGLWALEVAGTGEFIGFTGLNPMPAGVPGAGGMEVGWRLAESAWHQGYATEAATAALGVAFGGPDPGGQDPPGRPGLGPGRPGLGLAEIWSMTAVVNEPSQAVMRRIGMTRHAGFEHPAIEPGHPLRPHVVYRLAAPDGQERVHPPVEL
jgi:RimJ/RimL family protein N-acetyltransferase